MKKILLSLLIILTLLSVTAVSADDGVGDALADENVLSQEVNKISQDTGDDDSQPVLEDTDDSQAISKDACDTEIIGEDDSQSVLKEDSENNPIGETEVNKTTSSIAASNVNGYATFTTTLNIKLTSDGKALASKPVKIVLNGVTYNKNTDKDGKVKLNVKLNKGTYDAKITYLGDDLTTEATKTCKLTIKAPIKTKLKIGDKYINYRQGSKCLFYVKLLDANGKPIKNQLVTFKVAGKTYTAKTNKLGNAKIYLKLKKGTYKVKYSFKKNSPYLSSKGTFKIKVRAKMGKGDGYWLWSAHMKKVNLKSLAKKGTKQIFLHVQAISVHGKSAVVSFIKKAHRHGIKVHLWMQVCCVGEKWTRPISKNNNIKYAFLNKKIREAKRYAKIKGVDGIHFDYVRFGGTAHLYKDPNRAINYFMKKASAAVHKIKPNCIVSAALMPEPSMMTYYYGQDVATMSKYADALIPMVYKGNYHQTRSWITSVTKTFVGQSNGAQIWTGLQSYHSDANTKKLSHSSLLKDSKAAKKGGALGVVLFRIGISCNLNFKKV